MSSTLDQIRKRLGGEGVEKSNPCSEIPMPEPLTGDAKLRAENPGLQELWDQYQTMLKLVKPAVKPKTEGDTAADILNQIRARKASTPPTPKFKPKELSLEERMDAIEKILNSMKDSDE